MLSFCINWFQFPCQHIIEAYNLSLLMVLFAISVCGGLLYCSEVTCMQHADVLSCGVPVKFQMCIFKSVPIQCFYTVSLATGRASHLSKNTSMTVSKSSRIGDLA